MTEHELLQILRRRPQPPRSRQPFTAYDWLIWTALVMVIALMVFALASFADAQSIPDAPQLQPSAHFWTFRRSYDAPPLRSFKRSVGWCLAVNAPYIAAAITDVRLTHAQRENYSDSLISLGAISGMCLLYDRYLWRPLTLIGPVWGIQHHVHDIFRRGYQ